MMAWSQRRYGALVLTLQPSEMHYKKSVNPGHYDEGASCLTDKDWQLAAPSIELPQHDREVAVQLGKGKLERSIEKFQGYLDNCMCECTRKLDNTNSVLLWRSQKAGEDKGEFNMPRQGQCQVNNKRLVHFTSIRKLRVDRRHFSDDQLENSDHGLRHRKKQTATWARPPAEVVQASPEDRNIVRIGRTVGDGAGLRLGGIGRQELTSLGTAIIELRQRLADAEEACVHLQSEADQRSNERTRQRFMESLQMPPSVGGPQTRTTSPACKRSLSTSMRGARSIICSTGSAERRK